MHAHIEQNLDIIDNNITYLVTDTETAAYNEEDDYNYESHYCY